MLISPPDKFGKIFGTKYGEMPRYPLPPFNKVTAASAISGTPDMP